MQVTKAEIKDYVFLEEMYLDGFFPNFLVDKCKGILLELCEEIESQKPADLDELYALTHATTEAINNLQEEFHEADSEIETAARDCIAGEIEFIATTYGFKDVDIEEAIGPRDW